MKSSQWFLRILPFDSVQLTQEFWPRLQTSKELGTTKNPNWRIAWPLPGTSLAAGLFWDQISTSSVIRSALLTAPFLLYFWIFLLQGIKKVDPISNLNLSSAYDQKNNGFKGWPAGAKKTNWEVRSETRPDHDNSSVSCKMLLTHSKPRSTRLTTTAARLPMVTASAVPAKHSTLTWLLDAWFWNMLWKNGRHLHAHIAKYGRIRRRLSDVSCIKRTCLKEKHVRSCQCHFTQSIQS